MGCLSHTPMISSKTRQFITFVLMRWFGQAILAIMVCSVLECRGDNILHMADSLIVSNKVVKEGIKTYNWVEKVFNTYDTAYVAGMTNDFYLTLYSKNWLEKYRLNFRQGGHMNLSSDVMTNIGLDISWRFISVGYDENLNKFFNGYERRQRSFNLTINSALLNFNFYIQNNRLTADMNSFSTPAIVYPYSVRFNGMRTNRWGLNVCYFIKNRRYSQAAAFTYTRFQTKSAGSFFIGAAFYDNKYVFDFSTLPDEVVDNLPSVMENHTYRAHLRDYFLAGGYAFNWVLSQRLMIGVSESPLIGYRSGYVNPNTQSKFSFGNYLRLSVIYNINRFFIGGQGDLYSSYVRDRDVNLVENVITFRISVGCHFSI